MAYLLGTEENSYEIPGTWVWYFYICKREVWLMSRHVTPDQMDENIIIGRFLQEFTYKRERKEVELGNMKFDLVKKKNGHLVVGEIKKSSKFLKSAKMQLAYYLYQLETYGIEASGELLIPGEKKKEKVLLTTEVRNQLKKDIKEILKIVYQDNPPRPSKIKYCGKCAYREFCWA